MVCPITARAGTGTAGQDGRAAVQSAGPTGRHAQVLGRLDMRSVRTDFLPRGAGQRPGLSVAVKGGALRLIMASCHAVPPGRRWDRARLRWAVARSREQSTALAGMVFDSAESQGGPHGQGPQGRVDGVVTTGGAPSTVMLAQCGHQCTPPADCGSGVRYGKQH